jgi:putative FmdB family regulatory protein
MPTYDYLCPDCGASFEKFQSIKARVIRKCPSCSGKHLKRLIGAGSGVIFKGSGFYVNDYGKGKTKKENKEVAESKDKSASD